jgi:site-specific recombinase XerD
VSVSELVTYPTRQRRMREGPLGGYVDLYAENLIQQNYGREAAVRRVSIVSSLSRWLETRGLTSLTLDEGVLDQYLAYRWRHRSFQKQDRPALRKFLSLLRELDACPSRPPVVLDAREVALEEFKRYLSENVGFAAGSIAQYSSAVRQFISNQFPKGEPAWKEITAAKIITFIGGHARDHGHDCAHRMCSALRSFLRYLRYRGKIERDLASSVPTVPRWRLTGLPLSLTSQQVQRVLDRCHCDSAVGKRDYAILLLFCRLGLRAKEVVDLSLDDIDWHSGLITLRRTKTEEVAHLPLSAEVGAALADYLQNARPKSLSRRVFLRDQAPRIGFAQSSSLHGIVKRAFMRADVEVTPRGPHRFRHYVATELLRQGASLTEIGQLLRHRDLNSTRIYAKVDLAALRALTFPWPRAVR